MAQQIAIERKIITLDEILIMVTFAELAETVKQLSEDEIAELNAILKEKKEREILEASKQAMKDYEEGRTISLSSPGEIKKFFNELMNDND